MTKVKVAIIQPSYFPWRGFFSIMSLVDTFVFFDDVQYTRRDWRNRNRFEINGDISWLTVPIKSHSRSSKINQIEVNNEINWQEKHLKTFSHSYGKTPYFHDAYNLFSEIKSCNQDSLSELTISTCKSVAEYLGLKPKFVTSSSLGVDAETPSKRLALITSGLSGSVYLSGPTASDYLDLEEFTNRKIQVSFKNHDYEPYPRANRKALGGLSILDLIAFQGPKAVDFL